MKKVLAALLAAALCLPLSGCRTGLQRWETTYVDELFNTVTTVVGYRTSQADFLADAQAAHDRLAQLHRLFDIYHDYEGLNNLKTVNDRAGVAPVEVDPAILDLLTLAKDLYGRTGGRVNVAFGSVLSLWHRYREAGLEDPEGAQLPPMAQLEAAAAHTDIENVILDYDASTVYLADPELRLDVGAIAKGFAAERVCAALAAEGVDSLLLSVGGNVRAIGSQDGRGAPWRVGIQDPRDPGAYLWAVELTDASLVTSGSYQRYYTVDGVNYHHIIDPDTLMPAEHCTAVTVWTADSGLADALSTALFNLPYEDALALVQSLDGVEALWVLPGGEVRTTEGFPKNCKT